MGKEGLEDVLAAEVSEERDWVGKRLLRLI